MIARGAAGAQLLGANHALHHDHVIIYQRKEKPRSEEGRYINLLLSQLTSPLGDQRINVHEQGEQLMRLTEARLVPVEGDHDGALECPMAKPPVAAPHQGIVDRRIEDGAIDLAPLLNVHEAIVLGQLHRLLHGALDLGLQKAIDAVLELLPKIKATLLQARRPLQPALDQLQQRGLVLRAADGIDGLLVAEDIRVLLVVAHPLVSEHAQLVLDEPELQGLKARGGGQVLAEVHKVQGGHGLQNGHLVYEELIGK